jgi:hypothetical protein
MDDIKRIHCIPSRKMCRSQFASLPYQVQAFSTVEYQCDYGAELRYSRKLYLCKWRPQNCQSNEAAQTHRRQGLPRVYGCCSPNVPLPPWSRVLLNSLSTSQETPGILWNPRVDYLVHKSPPTLPVLSHDYPVQASSTQSCFLKPNFIFYPTIYA